MTEEEFQQRAKQFIQQLPDYPQLGKRPFGYPKDAWRMSGLWAVVGMMMQVPILFADGVNRGQIISSILGRFCLLCIHDAGRRVLNSGRRFCGSMAH